MPLSVTDQHALDEDGYILVAPLLAWDLLARRRQRVDQLFDEQGEGAGWELKREPGCRSRRLPLWGEPQGQPSG